VFESGGLFDPAGFDGVVPAAAAAAVVPELPLSTGDPGAVV